MPRIGGGDAVRNTAEAQRSGMAAYQQASQGLAGQVNTNRQFNEQNAQNIAGTVQRGMQQTADNEARDRQLGEQERSNQMREAIAQDEQDIQAADRGVERAAGGMSRADELRQQLAKQREEKQMNAALEVADPDRRTLVPTAERAAKDVQKAQTDRMNAEANRANAMRNLAEARAKGDEVKVKSALQDVQKDIQGNAKLFNALKTGKASEQDKTNLLKMASAGEGGVIDPALAQDIENLVPGVPMGPRLQQFLQNKIDFDSLTYIAAAHGEMPDPDLIDMASPMMQAFTQSAAQQKALLARIDGLTDSMISNTFGVTALAQRNRLVRRITAGAMLAQIEAGMMPQQGGLPPATQNNGQPRPQQQPAPGGQRPAPGAAPAGAQPAPRSDESYGSDWPAKFRPGGKQ